MTRQSLVWNKASSSETIQ